MTVKHTIAVSGPLEELSTRLDPDLENGGFQRAPADTQLPVASAPPPETIRLGEYSIPLLILGLILLVVPLGPVIVVFLLGKRGKPLLYTFLASLGGLLLFPLTFVAIGYSLCIALDQVDAEGRVLSFQSHNAARAAAGLQNTVNEVFQPAPRPQPPVEVGNQTTAHTTPTVIVVTDTNVGGPIKTEDEITVVPNPQ
eukprot:Filipodium_phascolosomae@DN3609_c0_g1_i1.p1